MMGEKDQKLVLDYIVDEMRIFPSSDSPTSSLPLNDTRVAAGVEIADEIMVRRWERGRGGGAHNPTRHPVSYA